MYVRLVKFVPRKGQTNFMTPYVYNGQSSLREIIVSGYCFYSFVLPLSCFNSEHMDKFLLFYICVFFSTKK